MIFILMSESHQSYGMHIGFDIFQTAGHAMPFDAGVFGHLLCYDTLHHMDDFTRPFPEFFGSYVSAGGNLR